MIEGFVRILDRTLSVMLIASLYIARLAGVVVLIVVAIVSLEVILRTFAGRSLGFSTEISGYSLALCVTWPLAYVLHQRAHIRIDILHTISSKKIQMLLDIIALSVLFIASCFMTNASIDIAAVSYFQGDIANTTLGTPLWLPRILWAGGFAWFSINALVILMRVTIDLVRGNAEGVQRLAGNEGGNVG